MKLKPKTTSAAAQLAGFIAKFAPEMAARITAARVKLRRLLPSAVELVYDNYNFLVIGYGPNERPSEAIMSLAAHARGLLLCFLDGVNLPDPPKLLRGSGRQVRNLRLPAADMLDEPPVRALIDAAVALSPKPFSTAAKSRLVIRSIAAKQRPRRLAASAARESKSGHRLS